VKIFAAYISLFKMMNLTFNQFEAVFLFLEVTNENSL